MVPMLARWRRAVRGRAAHLGIQRLGLEAPAQRHRGQVLHQHIDGLVRRDALFHPPGMHRGARGGGLHQLQAVRGHQRDARGPPWCVARAAGALQQARHALGRADLQHALHRQKVHAQVQAAGADHGAQAAALEPRLHPFAHTAVQRAVVDGDLPRPVRPRVQQRLVPLLGLRAHVDEHQRGAGRLLQRAHHRRQHGQAQVAGPGEALGPLGQQGVHHQALFHAAAHQRAALPAQQRLHGLGQVAQRGRHAPDQEPRVPAREPRQRQLHLHAAFVAQQLVPFIRHHQAHAGQLLARVRARQQQRQAFGGGDEHRGQTPRLGAAFGAAGIARACAQAPARQAGMLCGQGLQRRRQRTQRVGGQRAHGRDPQHGEWCGPRCCFVIYSVYRRMDGRYRPF